MAPAKWQLLAGKTAAITGGTTGIGRAIALEFLRQGCNVAINHLGLASDQQHLHSLMEEHKSIVEEAKQQSTGVAGEVLEIAGDVTEPSTGTILVEAAVIKWGKLDIFVSNAGVFEPAVFLT